MLLQSQTSQLVSCGTNEGSLQGFAERKLHLLYDILSSCQNYHQQAKRRERLANVRPLQASLNLALIHHSMCLAPLHFHTPCLRPSPASQSASGSLLATYLSLGLGCRQAASSVTLSGLSKLILPP